MQGSILNIFLLEQPGNNRMYNMDNTKLCNKCGKISNWNSYFQAYICGDCHHKEYKIMEHVEHTEVEYIDDDEIIYIGDVKFKCLKCDGIFLVRDGTFNYCPRCGRRILSQD